ncbi:MAG TPA: metal-dependent hydrolase, partial [Cupriavidus sp.]|nr:metal-dependent hydrolase [Cupriavidus sp.]
MKNPAEIDVAEQQRLESMAVGGLIGFRTLLYKEVLRFWKVSFQTVAAPVL